MTLRCIRHEPHVAAEVYLPIMRARALSHTIHRGEGVGYSDRVTTIHFRRPPPTLQLRHQPPPTKYEDRGAHCYRGCRSQPIYSPGSNDALNRRKGWT